MKRQIFNIRFNINVLLTLVIGLVLFLRCANTFNIDIVSEIGLGVGDINNNSAGELFNVFNNDWSTFSINISDLNRDSITSIGFSPVHQGTDGEGVYIDLIGATGDADTLIVEDFENYNLGSTTIEEGLDDRYWDGQVANNGTSASLTIVNEDNKKCLGFGYSNFFGNEVVCYFKLNFNNPQDWSKYNTISLRMKRIP